MAVKEIKQHPDEILTTPARPVDIKMMSGEANPSIKESWMRWIKNMVQDLIDTMEDSGGIGLAAPQIGQPFQVIVYKDGLDNKYLLNPQIIATSNIVKSYDEGCLSVKGRRLNVRRAKHVTVKGYTLNGDELAEVTVKSRNKLLSFELQHEIDHLNGQTILDRGK